MKILIAALLLTGILIASARTINTEVYKLSATPQGELRVFCANGADATIRPTNEFGSIIVSCGK